MDRRGATSEGNCAQRRSQRNMALRYMKRRRLLWTRSTIRVSIAAQRRRRARVGDIKGIGEVVRWPKRRRQAQQGSVSVRTLVVWISRLNPAGSWFLGAMRSDRAFQVSNDCRACAKQRSYMADKWVIGFAPNMWTLDRPGWVSYLLLQFECGCWKAWKLNWVQLQIKHDTEMRYNFKYIVWMSLN